jgi:hypothetical protein
MANTTIKQRQIAGNTLGYAEITSNFTTTTVSDKVDVTGLSVTVTVPSGGRRIKITGFCGAFRTTAASNSFSQLYIQEGTTVLQSLSNTLCDSYYFPTVIIASVVPSAGSHTYKITTSQSAEGTITVAAGATYPSFILVELI